MYATVITGSMIYAIDKQRNQHFACNYTTTTIMPVHHNHHQTIVVISYASFTNTTEHKLQQRLIRYNSQVTCFLNTYFKKCLRNTYRV